MSEMIRVTSPDGATSIMGAGCRRFFERKNNFLQGRKPRGGVKPKLYVVEDYDGPGADVVPSKKKGK